MRAVDILERKRDGMELSAEEISFVVDGYVVGAIPDYQMSAWCMAVLLRGMTDAETAALTRAMVASGDEIDLREIGRPTVDKHSTGGVGDKVTFVVAPVLAHLGAAVPMLSGRGLGHTGGTLDKLEAIPGFRAELSIDEFVRVTSGTGMAIAATSDRIVPADKKIYALRDASGTVPSLSLVVGSIMSKKLAVHADALVLDVKVGNGALFEDVRRAGDFADSAARLGKQFGRDVRAVFTSMDQPLGCTVGNRLEVDEALALLRGEGPDDLRDVCVAVGAQMILASKLADTQSSAETLFRSALQTGSAYDVFMRWAQAQGGDMSAYHAMPPAARRIEVRALTSGYVDEVRAVEVGRLSMQLGAGRERKEDTVDPAAGIVLHAKHGTRVDSGDLVATLHTNREDNEEPWLSAFHGALNIVARQPDERPALLGSVPVPA